MRLLLVLLAISAAGVVTAIRFLPWWGVVTLFAGLALASPLILKWGLMRLLTAPFRAKGAVLRGAAVRVDSVERAEGPGPDADGDEKGGAGPREHYRLEVTITPRPASGPFTLWEPGELMMVGPDARAEDPDADDSAGEVRRLEVLEDGAFQADSGMKYGGPQRLRLLLAVPPGQRQLRFRYYFEVFGNISLPVSAASAAPAGGPRR